MKKINFLLTLSVVLMFGRNISAQACQAGLTITPGIVAGEFTFTDNSTNATYGNLSINTGAGSNYNLLPPNSITHQFTSNGTFPYTYFISDGISCGDTITGLVTVTGILPCSIQAALTITPGTQPGQYTFTDNSTNASNGNLSIFDGTNSNYQLTSTSNSVTHTFPTNGTYLYIYSVYDNGICSDTLIDSLIVTSVPPCNVQAGLTVTNGSSPGEIILTDNSTNATAGAFLFISGSPVVQTLSPTSTSLTYSTNGTYTYTYAVINSNTNCGDTLQDSLIISTAQTPCNTQANLNIVPGANPGEYTFTDNSTNASIGTLDIFDGTTSSYQLIPSTPASHTFSSNGAYNYVYIVFDSSGVCSDTLAGIIAVNIPCPSFGGLTVTPAGTSGQFTFTDNSSSGTWSDLYPGFGSNVNILPNPSVTITYPANGTYNYVYLVGDTALSCMDTIYGTVNVTGITTSTPCQASFTLLQDTLNLSQYYCWNTATNGNGGTTGLMYFWDFGDGNTSSLAYPVHTYNSLGSYTLCLTISDTSGTCASTYCDTVTVTVKAQGTTINVLPAGANLGIEETEVFQSVSLFPNPAADITYVAIDASIESEVNIQVMTLSGQIVYAQKQNITAGQHKIKLDVVDMASGVYLVCVSDLNSGTQKSLRMIKR